MKWFAFSTFIIALPLIIFTLISLTLILGGIGSSVEAKPKVDELWRVENDEIICYGRKNLGLQCKFKEIPVIPKEQE